MKHIALFALACLLLSACAAPAPAATPTPVPDTPTPKPTATPVPPPGVSIFFVDTAQFEITTPDGWRVLIDVANPSKLTSPPTEQDILLVTHVHNDHYNKTFIDSFPGQKLIVEEGLIELPGVSIRGIASAHNTGQEFTPKDGTNYIFIIDVADLRLAHFGDIGQEEFTPEQLEALGQVDVAMTQLVNSFSYMNMENLKGFNLMEQLNPRMIIPTHSSKQATEEAVNRWAGYACEQPCFISKENLPPEASFLFISSLAAAYQKIYDLPWLTP
jgi:L-ascorbate metabolism protein UlaG (beta-lactamase superfamily)